MAMWHVEGFNARDNAADLETFLRDRFLPYFRARGFNVRCYATRVSLGPRDFWLATEIARFGDIDGWATRAGDEGGRLITQLLAMVTRIQGGVVEEL
jgi:hypothetical protein